VKVRGKCFGWRSTTEADQLCLLDQSQDRDEVHLLRICGLAMACSDELDEICSLKTSKVGISGNMETITTADAPNQTVLPHFGIGSYFLHQSPARSLNP
jgi:hypothetical protein